MMFSINFTPFNLKNLMIAFEEALNIVLSSATPLNSEKVTLNLSLNRILVQDLFSDMDMPPFDKSAVDGFACRKVDLGAPLTVIEVIRAGKVPENTVGESQCSGIMTGAMVPEGADTVIMVEDTDEISADQIRFVGTKTAANICHKAEDIHKGDKVLNKGTLIHASQIAVLASVGCVEPLVYRQPVVAILSTGDELVEPEYIPEPSQIRNSNAAQLTAQITAMNAIPLYLGIVPDDEEQTRKAIEQALAAADVVLLTGGVSMGDFDFVPMILKEQKVEILFNRIAVQPGKPTVFGHRDGKYVFGLPGNPVSSFVQFEMLVKPLLYALGDHAYRPIQLKLPLAVDYMRRNNQRRAFVPVTFLQPEGVVPIAYHGSAHIHAYVAAEGIMSVPIGISHLKKGELVDVRSL
jgi:molybdopterin molybdotransferase